MRRPLASIASVLVVAALLSAGAGLACADQPPVSVAVFPLDNLTGAPVSAAVREFLIETLSAAGIRVLGDAPLDEFMTRHRVRYSAGIDATTAESLRKETGVDAVVIASIELSSQSVPPKIALIVRIVSIKAAPVVVWADDAGLAGDEAPGLFDLGLIEDYEKLLKKGLDRVAGALVAYFKTGAAAPGAKTASAFRPKMAYRSPAVDAVKTPSVAVLPFVNGTDRRNAGDILALLFIRHLAGSDRFRVADSGVVRQQLLDARIIMDRGPSINDAQTVAALVDADFVLGGRVLRYEDPEDTGNPPRVEFSVVLIDRRSGRVVWGSDSYNDGRDTAGWFERGTTKTAHAMATQMVRLTTEMIAGRAR